MPVITLFALRNAARVSLDLHLNPTGQDDPLLTLLPGEGQERATGEQVDLVQDAIDDRPLRQHLFTDGRPMARNVSLLRSELRRWAIRTQSRGR